MVTTDRPSMKADEVRYGFCTYVDWSNVAQSRFCELPLPADPAGVSFAETFMEAKDEADLRNLLCLPYI